MQEGVVDEEKRIGRLKEDDRRHRRQRQHMLVIALHTGLAVFTYAFILTTLRRACEPHMLEMARDPSAYRVRHTLQRNVGILHDTTQRVAAVKPPDVSALAFDGVNACECLCLGWPKKEPRSRRPRC
jgi:hypothetical protein